MAFPASMPERAGQIPRPSPVFTANYGGMAFPASMPERAGQIPRPPPVFPANYGGMVFPASVPERAGQIPRPPPVFPANYGGMAFPASVPERIKGLFLGESTDRMLVQGNVWLLLPSVADYPALFECTKENCLFTVRV